MQHLVVGLLVQQQQRPPNSHHNPRLHHIPRSHQARDDTTSPTHTINGTRHQTSTVWSRSPRDGWRRGVAAARFPAKTPARTAAAKAHHLPVSEARRDFPPKRPRGPPQQMLILLCLFPKRGKAGGRGGVSSRLADTDATRPKEGGAWWLEERAE